MIFKFKARMPVKRACLLICLSTFYFTSHAMERLNTTAEGTRNFASNEEKRIAQIEAIKPISAKPITKVPQYVFENCNQVTRHTWSTEHLNKLRQAVGAISRDKLKEKNTQNAVFNQVQYVTTAEGYDWINALNLIEQEYIKKDLSLLSVEDILKINYAATRLTSKTPGQARSQDTHWKMHTFAVEELIFFHMMDTYILAKKLCKGEHFIKYDPNTMEVDTQSIRAFLNHYKNNREVMEAYSKNSEDPETAKILLMPINPDTVESWLIEQKRAPNAPTLSLRNWLKSRIYAFPPIGCIPEHLQGILQGLNLSAFSPFLKACILWFEIVKLHPFDEANKRTGKLLGSIILLQHGYLPPLINKENAQEYKDCLKYGFNKPDGHLVFAEFMAHMVNKTQHDPAIQKQLNV